MKDRKGTRNFAAFAMIVFIMLIGWSGALYAGGSSDQTEAKKSYVLKTGTDKAPGHAFVMGLERMSKSAQEKTGGAVSLQIYTDSVLGGEREMTESVSIGNLDATLSGLLGTYQPLLNMLDCPYLFTSRDQIRKFHDSASFTRLCGKIEESNIKVLTYFEGGFRQVTNNKKPIKTVADIKGLKMRTPEIQAMIETFKALGTVVTPMASKELYGALQQGVVDGQENPFANIYSSRFYEVQKYLAVTNHQYNSGYVYMNKDLYDKMPAEYQKAIMDSARDASLWQVKYSEDNDAGFLAKLKDAGMAVTEVNQDEFKAATASVYEVFYSKYGDEARALIKEIQAFAK
jgi:tripartite ATP-independent transporter DctP family solute receptor